MHIREVKTEDFRDITDILALYKKENGLEYSESDRELVLKTLTDALVEKNTVMYVAAKGKRILGFISCHFVPFALLKGWECYISELMVNKETRGQKIGQSLLTAVEDAAKRRNCVRLMLNNFRDIESYVRGFYKKNGFEERIRAANFVKSL